MSHWKENGKMKKTGILIIKGILILSFLLCSFKMYAQQEEIRWLTLQEAEQQCQKDPRPYIFDFYTDWCGWCKHMDKTTYTNPIVISFINRHFYPIRINAESSDTLIFRDKVYAPVKNGNKFISSLAVEMLGGKLSYPTTVFLYEPKKINIVVPGYMDVIKMQGFLVYFIENAWQSVNVNEFLADFEQVFGSNATESQEKVEYWTAFEDLEQKRAGQKKKILLFLGANWNNSTKMMERVVLPDSLFAAEAQEHFYCLHLDVQSADTITFMTHTFHNAGKQNNNLHQLAIALSDKILKVPGIYLFDEDGKLMETLSYYVDKGRGRMILDYIGNDLFKNMSWNDYVKMRSKETL